MTTVTVSSRFQIVIPLELRQRWQLQPGDRLRFVEFNGGVRLAPEVAPGSLRGIARCINTTPRCDQDRQL